MRLLVVIAHYFKREPGSNWYDNIGSGRAPLGRIAALNSELVALHRYFGPYRSANDPKFRAFDTVKPAVLDIVIVTVRDANLLERIGIDPSTYRVEYSDEPPMMLPFEAQRIMRDRVGGYDLYAYLEDDLTIVDPEFFDKITWFAAAFSPDAMLMPTRYEMAHSGTPAKIEFSPRLSSKLTALMRRVGLPPALTGRWHDRQQTFRLPNNPHSGCFFVTDEQLRRWIAHPSFYDRDTSFCDPLASAATYAPGRVFGLYKPAEPDPWFLAIEHYGTRYSAGFAPEGKTYGEPPLLSIAEASASGNGDLTSSGSGLPSINVTIAEAAQLRYQLDRITHSRTALAKALTKAMWNKLLRRD